MAYTQFGDLAQSTGGGILVALPARLGVIERPQAFGDLQHCFKSGLVRSMRGLIHNSVGLVIKTSGCFGRRRSEGHSNKGEQSPTEKEFHGTPLRLVSENLYSCEKQTSFPAI